MDFNEAFDDLILNEGGLSMDPNDRGNWTGGKVGVGTLKGSKFGVSAASYPTLDIAALTVDDARRIYLHDFWAASGCEAVPEAARFHLFDMAVNSGTRAAIKALQTAVGAVVDGVLGNETIMRAQSLPPMLLVAKFNAARLKHLTGMPREQWANEGQGLVNRVANNLMRS